LACCGGWDVHTHIVPPAVVKAGERGAYGMSAGSGTLTICQHGVPLHPIAETQKLLDRICSDQLDGAIVSVPPPLFRPDLSAHERRAYASLVNDGLLDACVRHGAELRPLAYVPVEAPEVALSVMESLDDQWAGVVMGTETGTISYASGRLDPVWEMMTARNLPLFIHPGSTPDSRLNDFYFTNLIGNPFETTIAAANIIFAGVLHRFPDLKIILAHGGGCLAALHGRWQRGVTTKRADIPLLAADPKETVRKFYVDSLVHSDAVLDMVIKVVGEDRILLGSDWPFPMGAPSAGHDLGRLDEQLQMKIRKLNAQRAFGSRLEIGGRIYEAS
jgi:aminocarboxymuconate-semialdehyde decarboxylase